LGKAADRLCEAFLDRFNAGDESSANGAEPDE